MKTFTGNVKYLEPIINPRDLYFFRDGTKLQFNRGGFDDYRVTYFPNLNQPQYGYSPKDVDYFSDLAELGRAFGAATVYEDFLQISLIVRDNGLRHEGDPDYSEETIELVRRELNHMVIKYPLNYRSDIFKLFMTLWTVMISEWYHEYPFGRSFLKHTPKVIAGHQVLNDLYSPEDAAIFSMNDEMINEVILVNNPNYNLNQAKRYRLKAIMDIYQIDSSWL
jgi:hypothetical protein